MAHELDNNAQTGRKSVFSVRLPMWHGEGFVTDEPPSLAGAMHLAGHDYEVLLGDLFTEVNGIAMPCPGHSVFRSDTGQILSTVGDTYVPIQNRTAFETLAPLVDSGVAAIETGGTLRGGRDAWMLVRFNLEDDDVRKALGDEVRPYGIISNNHAGERSARVEITPIRVVCANTLRMVAESRRQGSSIAVRHGSRGAANLVEAAQELFAGITARYRTVAEQFTVMRARRLTFDEYSRTVLDVLAPLPDATDKTPRFDSVMERAINLRNRLVHLWTNGDGHTGDKSAWEAFNAAVQSLDHDVDLFRVRGSRVESAQNGSLAQKKDSVAEAILALCR